LRKKFYEDSVSNYSIIGLGKLGSSIAAAIASKGHSVIGVDVNQRAVELLNSGMSPVDETDVQRIIEAHKTSVAATSDFRFAIASSDVSFVIVPTPSMEDGSFSLGYVKSAFTEIGRALKDKDDYHLVVLVSTVLPGSMAQQLVPLLGEESGKTAGEEFGVCYSPAFVALGSVVRDFMNPDLALIGELDARSGDVLERCYEEIFEKPKNVKRMSFENAEITKMAVNTFVTTKIAFANSLAQLCMSVPGGNVDHVTEALGCDSRIGPKCLKSAMGYGGPCFPRDNKALRAFATSTGNSLQLAEATDHSNTDFLDQTVQFINELGAEQNIAVLGLAYKPNTSVIDASPSIYLAERLNLSGHNIFAYDPLAGANAREVLSDNVVVTSTLAATLRHADVVLVTTTDPEFEMLDASSFVARPVTVVDFWRTLANKLIDVEGIHYIPYGRALESYEH
jgi:UDPglucose 6-dehydrogenase